MLHIPWFSIGSQVSRYQLSPWIGIKYLCIVWNRHRIRPYVAQSMDWYWISMCSVEFT